MMTLDDLPHVFRSHITIHSVTGCWIWRGAVSPRAIRFIIRGEHWVQEEPPTVC